MFGMRILGVDCGFVIAKDKIVYVGIQGRTRAVFGDHYAVYADSINGDCPKQRHQAVK